MKRRGGFNSLTSAATAALLAVGLVACANNDTTAGTIWEPVSLTSPGSTVEEMNAKHTMYDGTLTPDTGAKLRTSPTVDNGQDDGNPNIYTGPVVTGIINPELVEGDDDGPFACVTTINYGSICVQLALTSDSKGTDINTIQDLEGTRLSRTDDISMQGIATR